MTGPCGHWADGHPCAATQDVHAYLPGPRCPAHTPARVAGRREPVPDPDLTLAGIRAAAGIRVDYAPPAGPTAIDRAAVASGKRRTNAQDYQAAKETR